MLSREVRGNFYGVVCVHMMAGKGGKDRTELASGRTICACDQSVLGVQQQLRTKIGTYAGSSAKCARLVL